MGAGVPPSLPFGGPESSLRHIQMVGVITSVFLLLPSFLLLGSRYPLLLSLLTSKYYHHFMTYDF